MSNVVDHSEKLVSILYSHTSYNETDDWKSYPKNRIEVHLKDYSWKYKDNNWKIQDYSWKKVIIKNSKMESQYDDTGNLIAVVKKKANYNWAIVDDASHTSMSVDDFSNLILDGKTIYEEIEKSK